MSFDNGEVIHDWNKVRIDNYLDVVKLTTAPGWEKAKVHWIGTT